MLVIGTLAGGSSIEILTNSAETLQNTVDSWDQVWNEVFTASSPLWSSIVEFALVLAGLGLLYTSIKELNPILHESSWSRLAGLFATPLVIVLFLGGGGELGAQTVKMVRAIGFNHVSQMLDNQVAGQTFQVAIETIKTDSAAKDGLSQIYAECNALPEAERQECINDPDKAQQAQEIMSELGVTDPGLLGRLNPIGMITQVLMVMLYGVQWAFVNCLEAALVMTGLLFPIAMALSIMPLPTKPIYAWFVAMLSLFSVQMSYNIVVGLVATVALNAAGGSFMESSQDLAFAVFLSVFSPLLSVALGAGGGMALFQQGQTAIRGAIDGVTSGISTGALTYLAWRQNNAKPAAHHAASTSPVPPSQPASNALPQSRA